MFIDFISGSDYCHHITDFEMAKIRGPKYIHFSHKRATKILHAMEAAGYPNTVMTHVMPTINDGIFFSGTFDSEGFWASNCIFYCSEFCEVYEISLDNRIFGEPTIIEF